MTSLTDKYVAAVAERLPRDSRDDVAAELRATIADTAEARDDLSDEQAEREAIIGLGSPRVLAEKYRPGGPRYLIGPDAFPVWLQLIRIVVPVAILVGGGLNGIAAYVEGSSLGHVVRIAIGGAWNSAVYATIALTAIVAVVEHVDKRRFTEDCFDPEALPDPDAPRITLRDELGSIVFGLVLAGLVAAGTTQVTIDGVRTEVFTDLATDLRWIPFAGLLLAVAASVAVTGVGRWTRATVLTVIVGDLLFLIPVVWLLSANQLITPTVLQSASGDDGATWSRVIAAVLVVIVAADIWSTIRKYRQVR